MKNLRNVNLNLLPVLRELLIEQNVSLAGAKLNLSQSATSEALSRLRHLFDDQLLVQEGRKMRLTSFARQLLPQLEDSVRTIEKLLNEPQFDPSTSKRKFSIATADYVTELIGPIVLQDLQTHAPHVSIQFSGLHPNTLDDLSSATLDFCIVPSRIFEYEHLLQQTLFHDRFVVIVAKNNPHIGKRLTSKKFLELKHIMFRPDVKLSAIMEAQLDHHLPSPLKIAAWVNQFNLMGCFVADSDMLAVVQYRLAVRLAEQYNLNIYELPTGFADLTLAAHWSYEADRDPAIKWLVSRLIEICGKLDT